MMVLWGTKKASSASQTLAKKSTSILSSPPIPVKKPILASSLLSQALPSYYHHVTIRDLFEGKIYDAHDQNYNDNKATNNKFSIKD